MEGARETGTTPAHPEGTVRYRRPPWGIVLAAAAVAAVVTIAVVGNYLGPQPRALPGPQLSSPITPVLPSDGTSSGCIVGIPGIPRPTFDLQDGVLQGNTYNVPAGTTGHVGMCYDSSTGSVLAYANWSHVGGTGYNWFSYPQIAYGVNSWDGAASTYTGQNPNWSLPTTAASIAAGSVWFTTTYRFTPPPAADVDGYDLSLDDFFTETLPPQFEVGPFVEVEIFLAHNITYPFHYAPWAAPTLVGGVLTTAPWDVGWWCHGDSNSSNANVSFDFSYDGQSTQGLDQGTLGVDLSALVSEVETLMPSVSCWTGPVNGFSAFHLDEANLGSEDGALAGSAFNYSWTISSYCIASLGGAASAASLPCPAAAATPPGLPPLGDPGPPSAASPHGGAGAPPRS